MSGYRVAAASTALGAALAPAAFAAASGTATGTVTTVEIVVVLLVGLGFALLAVGGQLDEIVGSSKPVAGLGVLAAFTAFVLYTGFSATWSIDADATFGETSRLVMYLAAFAAAWMLARRTHDQARMVIGGVLIAGLAICIWALLTRILPSALADTVYEARLEAPLGYWNALGGLAALCIPATLWLASDRDIGRRLRAAAYPAMGLLLLTILLTQSRGALAAAILASALWLGFTPLRLRTVPVIALAAVTATPVAVWALSKPAFTEALEPLSSRQDVALPFGLLVLALVLTLGAAGFAVEVLARKDSPSPTTRRRIGTGLLALVAVVAVAAVVVTVASGKVSSGWHDLTSETAKTPGGGARFGSVSSARGLYWRQAGHVFAANPWIGTGANSFDLARLPYRKSITQASHAHGFIAQSLADLGILGVLLALALLAAWLAAAARALDVRRRGGAPFDSDRGARVGLALAVFAFGFQSAIDWTWYIPGPSLIALVAAGYIAGCRRPGEKPDQARASASGAGVRALLPTKRPSVPHLATAAGVLVLAVLCAWATWQPAASQHAVDRVYKLAEQHKLAEASAQADHARKVDPYSTDPVYAKSFVLQAQDRPVAAYKALEQAIIEHPRDPQPWIMIGRYELDDLDLPLRTIQSAGAALRIDPYSRIALLLSRRAQDTIRAGG